MNKERLYKRLREDEGVIYVIYLDHLGNRTFGVGHLITSREREWDYAVGTSVSGERVQECFEQDVAKAITNCEKLYGTHYTCWGDEVQEILINMMFNLGFTGLSKFKKMNAALKLYNWVEAAKEGRDSLWYKQVRNRAERLMSKLEKI